MGLNRAILDTSHNLLSARSGYRLASKHHFRFWPMLLKNSATGVTQLWRGVFEGKFYPCCDRPSTVIAVLTG
jgi:hypothetical protein